MLPSKLAKNYERPRENKLLTEFEKLDFSQTIIEEAYSIWQEIDINNKKGNQKRKLKFLCVYAAHMRLGVVQDLECIAEKLDITKKHAVRSFITFSESQTGFKLPLIQFTISDFLKLYTTRLDLESYYDEIQSILEEIKKSKDLERKNKILISTKPQNVAAAIIDYYYSKNGNLLKLADYERLYKKKETVNPVKTQLSLLLHN